MCDKEACGRKAPLSREFQAMINSPCRTPALIVISVFILVLSGPVHAEPGQLEAFQRAQRLVQESLSRHGDHRAAEAAGGFQVRLQGTYDLTTRLQGRSAFRDEPTAIEEHIAYDAGEGRVSYDADYFNYFSSNQKYREIFDDQGRMIYIDRLNANGGWVPLEMVRDIRERYLRVLPGMLLAEALAHPRSLRYLGESEAGGARVDMVSFTTRGGDALRLSIDRETRLLSSVSSLIDMPLLGWTTMSWNWTEYAPAESGVTAPGRLQVRLGDRMLKDVAMTVEFGTVPDAFEAPEGVEIGDPPEDLLGLSDFVPYGQRPPVVETLMPQVYLVKSLRPGFGLLFVEFDEYVVAVDAPTGWYEMNQIPPMNWSHGDAIDALGKKYQAAIRQTVPDKPVRYVVLTHHHSDHIGGILPFIDAGAKVIAGANAAHLVRIAVANREARPSGTGQAPGGDFMEIVDEEYAISDGSMIMRLIELPDENPKADNYLMVYVPEQKLLYTTGFIYPVPEEVFPPKESIPLSQYFVKWLDESGLDVDHIYNVHGMNKVESWHLETIRQLSSTPP